MNWMATTTKAGTPCVYPIDDMRPHEIDDPCWCKPFDEDGVIVHNSMDRREEYERGRQMT